MSQENQTTPEVSNDLMSAFLDTTVTEPIIVKAEDVPLGTGMNFSDIFFEPGEARRYFQKCFFFRLKKRRDPGKQSGAFSVCDAFFHGRIF